MRASTPFRLKTESKNFFFEKKKQKTFCSPRLLSGHSLAAQQPGESGVFLLLFLQKKKFFLPS